MYAPGRGFVLTNLPHSEKLRTHAENAVGTNCGRNAAACKRRCAASLLSARNVFHQKSLQSNPDRMALARSPAAARIPFASIPTRFLPDREFQMRSLPRDGLHTARGQNSQDQSYRIAASAVPRPTDIGVDPQIPVLRKPRDETALPSAACVPAISRMPKPRHGLHKLERPSSTAARQTSLCKSRYFPYVPRRPDVLFRFAHAIPNLLCSTAKVLDSRRSVQNAKIRGLSHCDFQC